MHTSFISNKVLMMVAAGSTTAEIIGALKVSRSTVRRDRRHAHFHGGQPSSTRVNAVNNGPRRVPPVS